MDAEPLPVVESGPESLFRLASLEHDGRSVRATMPAGPWLTGPDGRPLAGSLGVLVDNVLGYAIIARRPPGRWSVSAEISIDVLEPLPTTGTVRAEASVLHADDLGGFASGRVIDDDGRLLAVAHQRGRFVPADGVDLDPAPFQPVAGSEDVVPWLGRTHARPGARTVPDLLANPMGNLHGGVSVCLADLVARDQVAPHLRAASLHTTFTRAVPVGAALAFSATTQHAGRTLAVVDVVGTADDKVATVSRVVLHPGT